MPLPIDFDTVQVYGSYVDPDGSAPEGTVTFTAQYRLRSGATKTSILPGKIVVALLDGAFTTMLPCTDDPDIVPDGWAWWVQESFGPAGREPTYTRTYLMLAPRGDAIDLTNVQPAVPPGPTPANSIITVVGKGANAEGNVPISLDDLSDTTITAPATGQLLRYNGTEWANSTSTGSGDLVAANNLSDVANPATARTNLGLGGAATLDVGTLAGTVAAADDPRLAAALQGANNLLDVWDPPTARANLGVLDPLPVGTTPGTVAAGDHVHAEADVTGLTADLATLTAGLAAKTPTSRTVTAGTGLTGGGDLTADRTLAVTIGTAAGTVAAGDDARFGTLAGSHVGTPTVAALAAAGTGATASVTGADMAGTLTLTTGTAPTLGQLATVSFGVTFPTAPRISVNPRNANAGTLVGAGMYANATTTQIQLSAVTAPTASAIHIFDWFLMP